MTGLISRAFSRRSIFGFMGGAVAAVAMPVVSQSSAAEAGSSLPPFSGLTSAQLETAEFFDRYRYVCLFGGARSGKTTAIVDNIIRRALKYPKSRHVILRNNGLRACVTIGQDTLPKVLRTFFPGLHHANTASFYERQYRNFIDLPNRSQIWVGGLDDEHFIDRTVGGGYDTVFLNECSQIEWSAAKLLKIRIDDPIDRRSVVPSRFYCDLNPLDASHWTYRLFGDVVDPDTGDLLSDPENYVLACLNTVGNPLLDPMFLTSLEQSTGDYRRRFYEGRYANAERI